jgi:hypothetical protein
MTRFKIIATALGLVVAAGAIGQASAETIVKTVKVATLTGAKVTKVVVLPHHRLHFGNRIVKHIRIVRVAPRHVRVVKIEKLGLQHHAMNHRVVTKTVIR